MTREEFCVALADTLAAPPETPSGELVVRWEAQLAQTKAELAKGGHPKPVRWRLQSDLMRLEEAADLAAQLRLIAEVEKYFGEIDQELARPNPTRGVLVLCLEKIRPLIQRTADDSLRFEFEKRLALSEARLPALPKPEPVAVPDPADRPQPAPPRPEIKPIKPVVEPVVTIAARTRTPVAGQVLDLLPAVLEGTLRRPMPNIQFVARAQFTLGRKGSADFTALFLPETAENKEKTRTISRVNTTLFLRGHQICVQDGEIAADGSQKPSVNGTIIDDKKITTALPLNFAKERRVKLGRPHSFEIRVVHLAGTTTGGPLSGAATGTLATQGATVVVGDRPTGCVRFSPFTNPDLPNLGVWIFSEASLGSSPDAAVILDRALPPVAVRVHYWSGGFWLEVPTDGKSVVSIDDRRTAAGEVFALQTSHRLTLGEHSFNLKVS